MDVFYPEVIDETPLPQDSSLVGMDVSTPSSGSGENKTYGQTQIDERTLPENLVAVEVLSSALNTKSKKVLQKFQLEQSGGFQIGTYKPGESGDVKLTPAGMTARNTDGVTTFALDGETGSAVFSGSIQAGSLISGLVAVGDNSIVIDGVNRRQVWYDPDNGLASIIIGNA